MKEKSRLKLFLENMLFFGGLAALVKVIPFITLPIITKMLPDTSAYGWVDLYNVALSFGTAISIMGIYDALFREFFEKKDDELHKKRVAATALNLVVCISFSISALIIVFSFVFSKYLPKEIQNNNLNILLVSSIFLGAISSIIAAPTRMRNEKKVYLIIGFVSPILNVIFILFFIKLGYTFQSMIYSSFLLNLIMFIAYYFLNKKDFSIKIFDKKIAKELLKIGIPLMPSFLIYWIYNSMDRIMISNMIGVAELGIYSIGSKVASVSQLIYAAFAGGWQYFAFSTMKDKDQVKLNSKVFEYLGIISFIAYIFIIPINRFIFNYLFTGNYTRGFEVFPLLFLSPLILMLFQTIGNQVLVIKKSYLSTLSLIFGVVINLILNFLLIKSHGIRGAAFATLSSYIVSVFVMALICKKYKLVNISKKFIIISCAMFLGIIADFLNLKYLYIFLYFFTFVFIFTFYFKEVYLLLKKLISK
ncbi:MAG: lipopolysaccharide biosynthesis protein [Fusobacteriaceae bacterium]